MGKSKFLKSIVLSGILTLGISCATAGKNIGQWREQRKIERERNRIYYLDVIVDYNDTKVMRSDEELKETLKNKGLLKSDYLSTYSSTPRN